MIVLEKRRILLVLCMIFVSISTYLFALASNKETIQTMSLPVTGKVVVLDAGHGRRRWWSKLWKRNYRGGY